MNQNLPQLYNGQQLLFEMILISSYPRPHFGGIWQRVLSHTGRQGRGRVIKVVGHHTFNERSSQRDDGHHSPHDCLEQQSSVVLINTSPSWVHTMGSGRGQMMGSHSTFIVCLSQTQFLQPLFQVSPPCLGDEDLGVGAARKKHWKCSVIDALPF